MTAVLGAACAFAVVSVLVKLAYAAGARPESLLEARLLVAAALLAPAATVRLPARQVALAAVAGLAFAGAGRLEFEALARLPAPTVVLLVFIAPVWVGLGSWLLGRGARRSEAAAVGLVVVGVALVAGAPSARPLDAVGIAAGFLASLASAAFFVALRELAVRAPATRAAGLTALAAAVAATVAEPGFPPEVTRPETAWYAVAIGALTACALWLICIGLRGASPLPGSAIACAEPVVAALLAWLVLGELLAWPQVLGASAVLVGVVVATAPGFPWPGATGRTTRRRRGSPRRLRPARSARRHR